LTGVGCAPLALDLLLAVSRVLLRVLSTSFLHIARSGRRRGYRLQIADNPAAWRPVRLTAAYDILAASPARRGRARISGFDDNAMTILSNSKKRHNSPIIAKSQPSARRTCRGIRTLPSAPGG